MAVPHPIPYQGSKRRLASAILAEAPKTIDRLIEPFAGSAAITLSAATNGVARQYLLGDSLPSLVEIWNAVLRDPKGLADAYEHVWRRQLANPGRHYLRVRAEFNRAREKNPAQLLYLLARCTKNSVRFNRAGEFNQSADPRRLGMSPAKMRANIIQAHSVLRGRTETVCADYEAALEQATNQDLVYLDPPYQGVSGRNPRYFQQLDFPRLVKNLRQLNSRNVPLILSFDGKCGTKEYGQKLPRDLKLTHILLPAGRSAQATLNGHEDETTESIYLSTALLSHC